MNRETLPRTSLKGKALTAFGKAAGETAGKIEKFGERCQEYAWDHPRLESIGSVTVKLAERVAPFALLGGIILGAAACTNGETIFQAIESIKALPRPNGSYLDLYLEGFGAFAIGSGFGLLCFDAFTSHDNSFTNKAIQSAIHHLDPHTKAYVCGGIPLENVATFIAIPFRRIERVCRDSKKEGSLSIA